VSAPYAFVARIEAKPEKAEDVAALLISALPLAEAESGTVNWYAARTSPTTFWIFDTFGSEDARQAHINGEIAAALMANAEELLATPTNSIPYPGMFVNRRLDGSARILGSARRAR
jgi:quinol monooxygenase YgiN